MARGRAGAAREVPLVWANEQYKAYIMGPDGHVKVKTVATFFCARAKQLADGRHRALAA
jgi:hypothetical protein